MAEKEYIERTALLQFLKDEIKQCEDDYGDDYEEDDYYTQAVVSRMTAMRHVKRRVEQSPAADVAPVVHARWKDNHCTACGMMPMGEELWDSCEFAPPKFEYFMDFCPSCGAKMDGERYAKKTN